MHEVTASLIVSLAGVAEQSDDFVTDLDDATAANSGASHDDHRHHRL
jgi:hypothetical protein